jgi:hypothetical protein
VFTAVEVAFYYFEEWGWVAEGVALTVILVLSAAKFLGVVMFYMHLKFDHKLFAGIFVFPAVLGALVIALWLLNQYIHPFHPREAAPVQIIRAPVPQLPRPRRPPTRRRLRAGARVGRLTRPPSRSERQVRCSSASRSYTASPSRGRSGGSTRLHDGVAPDGGSLLPGRRPAPPPVPRLPAGAAKRRWRRSRSGWR